MFKKGDKVVQVQAAPITGTVSGFSLCQETGAVHVLVDYVDEAGEAHTRHFLQEQVSAVPEVAAG